MKQILVLYLTCLLSINSHSQNISLVKIINPPNDASIEDLTDVNGVLYFTSNLGLMKSDGVETVVVFVKPIAAQSLMNKNGILFFGANNGNGDEVLWRTDGTMNGTFIVSNKPVYFNSFTVNVVVGDLLFFIAAGNLWVTDGTDSGTKIITSSTSAIIKLLALGNSVYFEKRDPVTSAITLWKSDGTSNGTIAIKSFTSNWGINFGIIANGKLYFQYGTQLWNTNGTEQGTVLIKDTNANSPAPANFEVTENGSVFFSATDGVYGVELWKSDGTTNGTYMVKDINTLSGNYGSGLMITPKSTLKNTLYFSADNGTNGNELWKSDATEGGTVMVKDINPYQFGAGIGSVISFQKKIYFTADNGINGLELWVTDGTNTNLIADINTKGDSRPTFLTCSGNNLFFVAEDGINGRQLWKLSNCNNTPVCIPVTFRIRK